MTVEDINPEDCDFILTDDEDDLSEMNFWDEECQTDPQVPDLYQGQTAFLELE